MGNPVSCDICKTKHLRTIINRSNSSWEYTQSQEAWLLYVYFYCNGEDKWLTKGEV